MSKGIIGSNANKPAFSSVCFGHLDEKAERKQENVQRRLERGERVDTKFCCSGNGYQTMMVILTSAVVILSLVAISLLVLVVELKLEMREFQTQLDSLRNEKLQADENTLNLALQPSRHPSAVHHFSEVLHRNIRSKNGPGKKDKKKQRRNTKAPKTPKTTEAPETKEVENEMKKFCFTQIKNATFRQLDTVEFEGYFYQNYNYSKAENCFRDNVHNCEVCNNNSIVYRKKYSPLHVYHLKNTSTDANKMIRKVNDSTFEVVTSGSYLLHLNIVMVDYEPLKNHSIGVFVNGKVLLACPKGGILMPQPKHDDIDKYRLCSIDGMVDLRANDKIEIKTMQPHTEVRLRESDKSLFKLILLLPSLDHVNANNTSTKS